MGGKSPIEVYRIMLVTPDTYDEALEYIQEYPAWTVDVETNGFNWYDTNQICGIGVGVGWEPKTFYFPFRHFPCLLYTSDAADE